MSGTFHPIGTSHSFHRVFEARHPTPTSAIARLQEGEAVAGGSESSEYRNLAVSGAEAVLEAPPPQSSAFAPHQVRTSDGDDVTWWSAPARRCRRAAETHIPSTAPVKASNQPGIPAGCRFQNSENRLPVNVSSPTASPLTSAAAQAGDLAGGCKLLLTCWGKSTCC